MVSFVWNSVSFIHSVRDSGITDVVHIFSPPRPKSRHTYLLLDPCKGTSIVSLSKKGNSIQSAQDSCGLGSPRVLLVAPKSSYHVWRVPNERNVLVELAPSSVPARYLLVVKKILQSRRWDAPGHDRLTYTLYQEVKTVGATTRN